MHGMVRHDTDQRVRGALATCEPQWLSPLRIDDDWAGTIGRLTRNSHETGSGHCIDRHCIGLRTSTLPPIAAIAMSTATRAAFSVFMSAPRMATAHRDWVGSASHEASTDVSPSLVQRCTILRVVLVSQSDLVVWCRASARLAVVGLRRPSRRMHPRPARARAVTRAGSRTRAMGGKALALHKGGGRGGTKIHLGSAAGNGRGFSRGEWNERSVGVHPCIDLLEALMMSTSTSSCPRRACRAPLTGTNLGSSNPISVRW